MPGALASPVRVARPQDHCDTDTAGGIALSKPTVIDETPSCLMIWGAQIQACKVQRTYRSRSETMPALEDSQSADNSVPCAAVFLASSLHHTDQPGALVFLKPFRLSGLSVM